MKEMCKKKNGEMVTETKEGEEKEERGVRRERFMQEEEKRKRKRTIRGERRGGEGGER